MQSCLSVAYKITSPVESFPSDLKTFNIEAHQYKQQIGVNPINEQHIKNTIFLNLRENDYIYQKDGDLAVRYFVKNELKEYVEGLDDDYARWEDGKPPTDKIQSYTEGTLSIDIIDRKNQKLLWHGEVVGPVYDNLKNSKKVIRQVVKEVLQDFFLKISSSS